MASSDSSELAPPMLLRILLSSDRGVVGVVGVRGVVGSFTGEDLDANRRVGAASVIYKAVALFFVSDREKPTSEKHFPVVLTPHKKQAFFHKGAHVTTNEFV